MTASPLPHSRRPVEAERVGAARAQARARDLAAGIAVPWRSWLTSGMAVVLLAAGASRAQADAAYGERSRTTRHSPAETVARMVARAQAHGLAVVAIIPMPERQAEWLVLGPCPDETAVIHHAPQATLELPLALQIRERDGGGAEVRFHGADMPGAHTLPAEVRETVAALPALVDEALG
jgi:uncharacterized protein (DUF302 family)